MLAGHIPNGIIFAESKDWQFRRKLLTPTFSTSRMKLVIIMDEIFGPLQ